MRTMMAMSINQKLEDIKVSRYLMGWDSRNCVYVTELMDEEESGPLKT
jgi:ethanolamine utilization protein EutQ (cupin superfamily)